MDNVVFVPVNSVMERSSCRFRRSERVQTFRVEYGNSPMVELVQITEELTEAFEQAVRGLIADGADHQDFVSVYLTSPELGKDLFVRPTKVGAFSGENFFAAISRIAQSSRLWLLKGMVKKCQSLIHCSQLY